MKRREFLRNTTFLGAGTSLGMASGCSDSGSQPQSPVSFVPGNAVPWINWAGNEYCYPQWRQSPSTTDQVVDIMKSAQGVIRAVGSGHSFSAVVPTDDTLVSTDLLTGLVSHDADRMQATLRGGTTLHDMGPLLDSIGQAVPNMPDMDYPTIAGAVANSVHATGNSFGSMSAYVVSMELVTPAGDVIECSAARNPEIFHAARTSVGSLGITTEITLQNIAPFDLTESNKVENIEDVWASIEQRCKQHRHFEFFPIPYSDLCVTVSTDIAREGDKNIGEDDPQAVNALREAFNATSWVPLIGDRLYNKALKLGMSEDAETVRTGKSWQVFPHVRMVRFREMEYTVPADAGPECVQEILRTIEKRQLPLSFPFEYRYVDADDIWLSMFEGRAGCSISVHQYGDLDYRKVFAEVEPIFWKYEGRPHWGKIHTLDAKRLAALYPKHWQDFHELRRILDPEGRMMNAHMKQVFGEA